MGLVILRRKLQARSSSKRLLEKAAGRLTVGAREAAGSDPCFSLRGNNNFDDLAQLVPLTLTVSLMEPSASCCSMTVCPCLRPSILHFSAA